jgi:hypothetical protein
MKTNRCRHKGRTERIASEILRTVASLNDMADASAVFLDMAAGDRFGRKFRRLKKKTPWIVCIFLNIRNNLSYIIPYEKNNVNIKNKFK